MLSTLKPAAWGLVVLGLVVGVLGDVFGWYDRFAWFDEVLHFHTSFFVTLLISLYANASLFRGRPAHPVWQVLLVAGAGIGLGVVWEIGELVVDQSNLHDPIKGRFDTSFDLVMDATAALIAATLGRLFLRDSRAGSHAGRRQRAGA